MYMDNVYSRASSGIRLPLNFFPPSQDGDETLEAAPLPLPFYSPPLSPIRRGASGSVDALPSLDGGGKESEALRSARKRAAEMTREQEINHPGSSIPRGLLPNVEGDASNARPTLDALASLRPVWNNKGSDCAF